LLLFFSKLVKIVTQWWLFQLHRNHRKCICKMWSKRKCLNSPKHFPSTLIAPFYPFRVFSYTPSLVSTPLALYSHPSLQITHPFGNTERKVWFLVRGVLSNGLILGPLPQVPFYFFSLFWVQIPTASISNWVQLQAFSIIQIFVCWICTI